MSIVIGIADGATAIINLLIRRAFPYAFILELTPPPPPPLLLLPPETPITI